VPTIDDVARAAGVGIGTVSRVLNGSPLVSDALRERVLLAIEQLGYRPSPVARAFGRRRTHVLELLVPLFIGPLFLQVLRGIEEALADNGYSLLIHTVQDAADRDHAFEACCARGQSDGALALWMLPPESRLERLLGDGVPMVLLNVSHARVASVGVDHDASARLAVEYCARIGHRRIALVDRPLDVFEPEGTGICERGYRDAMADLGLRVRETYERKAALSQPAGAAALESLAELPERPTAIVAASDEQAIGIVHAARGRGWQVPGDLSVVGYSDSQLADYLGLTTIAAPVREIGREATRLLLDAVATPAAAPRTIYQPSELIVRGTCGSPRP
jgi:DNA-binding LacI/PurR family transcriptional regulator